MKKPQFLQNILNYISNHRKVTKTQLNNTKYEILDVVDIVDSQVQKNTSNIAKNRADIGNLAAQIEFDKGDYTKLASELEQIKDNLYLKDVETEGVTTNERELLTNIIKLIDPNAATQDLLLDRWEHFEGGEHRLVYQTGNETKRIPVNILYDKVTEIEQTKADEARVENKAKWAGRKQSFKEWATKPRFIDQRIRKDLVTTIENAYKVEGYEPRIELTKIKGSRENPNTKISFRDANGSGEIYTESIHTLQALEANELESKSELKHKYINQMKHQKVKKPSKIRNAIQGLKALKEELVCDPLTKFTPEEREITDGLDQMVQSYRVEAAEAKSGKVGPLKAVTNYISERNHQRKKHDLAEDISVYMGLDAKTDVEVTGINGKLRKDDTTISHTITDKTGRTTDCYMTVGELKELKAAYKAQPKAQSIDEFVEEKGPSKWDAFKENTSATYNTIKTSIGMFASDVKSGANSFGKYIGSKIANSAAKSVRNKNTKAKRQEAEYFAEVIGEHIDAKANDCIEILNVNNLSVTYNVNGMVNHKVQRVDLEDAASSLGQKQYVADLNKQRTRRQIGIYALGPLTGLIKK